ncbi:MAG: hypothetical protein KKB03_04225 [Nanoarchaeota archaeon]|nr:hypothetical protein [Nanoarchaeota archaeon]MBU1135402.1 hypothetical protein [Nanoarchaeota archaeon]MBU2520420.1 hypothetical protein [Nanoarchaeota archaeon]
MKHFLAISILIAMLIIAGCSTLQPKMKEVINDDTRNDGIEVSVHFKITGDYFCTLGKEYSWQNPVYTMRTFPENLMNPDGSRAYPEWTGGFIGVMGKQVEDFNDFHKKWWLDDMLEDILVDYTD